MQVPAVEPPGEVTGEGGAADRSEEHAVCRTVVVAARLGHERGWGSGRGGEPGLPGSGDPPMQYLGVDWVGRGRLPAVGRPHLDSLVSTSTSDASKTSAISGSNGWPVTSTSTCLNPHRR